MTRVAHPTSNDRLRINRLVAECHVPDDHPARAAVAGRLKDALANRLAETLGDSLRGGGAGHDPSVWLIRRLAVASDVSLDWPADEVCRVVGADILRSMAGVIGGGADGQDVRHFPDRAAYLAAFLLDRAAGLGDAWYYRAFEGVRALPASAALRTVLLNEPADGLSALQRLSTDGRRRVIAALDAHDAGLLLDGLADVGTDSGDALAAAWGAWPEVSAPGGDERHARLRLYLAAATPERGGPALRAAVVALVRYARRLTEDGIDVIDALRQGDSADDAEALAPLLAADPAWVRTVREALVAVSRDAGTFTPMAASRHTPFGGAFFLLAMLARLPLDDATASWPMLEDASLADVARFLLLAHCFGPGQRDVLDDALLRDVMHVPPTLNADALCAWRTARSAEECGHFLDVLAEWSAEHSLVAAAAPDARTADPFLMESTEPPTPGAAAFAGAAGEVLRAFAHRLPGFAESTPRYVVENFLTFDAVVERVAGRYVVRLDRPPLHMMLSLTGIARDTYTLPWQDVPFEIGFATEGTA